MTDDIEKRAVELATRLLGRTLSSKATQEIIVAALLAALLAERERAIREAAAVVHQRAELPDCDFSTYDSCNMWECRREARGRDCLCMERVEQAESLEKLVLALLEPAK